MFTLLQENRTELLDSHTAGEGVDANEAVEIIESEEESNVRSTKRPLAAKKGKETKRQKREKQENTLLQKAIVCMEGTSNKITAKKDADDIFGEYVTSELRAMHNVEMKRWVKFRIQSLLFSAQSGMGSPHMTQPLLPQQFTPPSIRGPWDIPQWNATPCNTPSTSSLSGENNAEYNEF